ncbi:MAG: DUF1592 domain-containing protein [Myxococcales bacterium]|nr:DUF1592 domain-containing protein [Myxococcales bacterium]
MWMQSLAGVVLAVVLGWVGCASPGAGDGRDPKDPADANTLARGAALYGELCAVCHGHQGQGGSGPVLAGFSRGEAELTSIIDQRMPVGRPEQCRGACARDIARFILAGFPKAQPVCDGNGAGPRRLRLLSRREYRSTISALFGWDDSRCPMPEFRFKPTTGMPKTVHLAGSMNGWPGTIAAGGWPLAFDSAAGAFRLRRALPVGSYQYKFVIDEKDWIPDPENPNRVPDGFGGQNSLISVSCKPVAPPPPTVDVAASLPPDARPDGFPFDDHTEARVVSPVHAEEYRRAAMTIATAVAADVAPLVPCDGSGGNRAACTEQFVRSFGLRAFRRPLLPSERTRYQALAASAARFELGITQVIAALLQSPHFLYRSELGEARPDGRYRLTAYELASALSYLYWGTMPDADLFAAAERGELATSAGIEKQARRLLGDVRAREPMGEFALQWLGVERVFTADKRADQFPAWTPALRQDLAEETRRFVRHVVFDGSGTLGELFTADYSFLNESLAKLYGLAGATGSTLVRRSYGSDQRRGLLGHGSVLSSYAHSDQTSPIRRGLLVRRTLLCQELPTPPPNAGSIPAVDAAATTRERFRQHTQNPFCKGCHQYIDGVGFGFERFDAIGQPRDTERSMPIDDSGDLNDLEGLGSGHSAPYRGLVELGQRLSQADSARACFVRQALRFARGIHEDVAADLCLLSRLRVRFSEQGDRIAELWVALSLQPEFLYRR